MGLSSVEEALDRELQALRVSNKRQELLKLQEEAASPVRKVILKETVSPLRLKKVTPATLRSAVNVAQELENATGIEEYDPEERGKVGGVKSRAGWMLGMTSLLSTSHGRIFTWGPATSH